MGLARTKVTPQYLRGQPTACCAFRRSKEGTRHRIDLREEDFPCTSMVLHCPETALALTIPGPVVKQKDVNLVSFPVLSQIKPQAPVNSTQL